MNEEVEVEDVDAESGELEAKMAVIEDRKVIVACRKDLSLDSSKHSSLYSLMK